MTAPRVVRVDGVDTATGKSRPKQIGTFPSRRAAQRAVAALLADGGGSQAERGTVGWLVDRWVASRTDVGPKAREQHAWAATHVKAGLGGVRVDLLDRDDVASWLDDRATGGKLSRRSIESCQIRISTGLCGGSEEWS